MRLNFIEVATRYQAKKRCPWATIFARVIGGYMAFEGINDYKTWKRQR